MTKNEKILMEILIDIEKRLENTLYHGRIIVELDIVAGNISKKYKVNNETRIVG